MSCLISYRLSIYFSQQDSFLENAWSKQFRFFCPYFLHWCHIKIYSIAHYRRFNADFIVNSYNSHILGWTNALPIYVLLSLYNQTPQVSLSNNFQYNLKTQRSALISFSNLHGMHWIKDYWPFFKWEGSVWFRYESCKKLASPWPPGLIKIVFNENC